MDEELEAMVAPVRLDLSSFSKDVAQMRAALEGPLSAGADRAGRTIESALLRAVRSGKFGFEDLGKVAMSVLSSIASAAVRQGVGAISGSGGSGSGLLTLASSVLGALGLPGRATGGPVSPGRGYVVGERGPELFVPTASGNVIAAGQAARDVRISINVASGGQDGARALSRSARQVARAVRAAMDE
jgi:uncharacterized protein YgbK (DUF1537 family)